MDNKLSEPSDNITDALNSLRGWKQIAEAAEKRISALLAELEAKDKRIANLEFEQGGYGYSVLEDLNGKIKRIAELEAKLATPVRLPAYRNSPDMHTKQYYEAIGFNQALDACGNDIRAAGFTVEGDE